MQISSGIQRFSWQERGMFSWGSGLRDINLAVEALLRHQVICAHIRYRVNGLYRLRFYSASLLIDPEAGPDKSKQNALAHHSAPRCRSVYPNADPEPWAAAMGHPWPGAANPASLPGCPRFRICVRPAWFNGAPQIKIKSAAA